MCSAGRRGGMRPFVESTVEHMRLTAEQQRRYVEYEREGGPEPDFLVKRKMPKLNVGANRKKRQTNARQGPAPAIARSGGGGADPRSLVSLSGGGIPAVRSFFTPV